MKLINNIRLKNFKRFKQTEIEFNDDINILVGDNESGKSSILQAIYLVLSGSKTKVDNIGLECLFNVEIIQDFMNTSKKYEELPYMFIELYLNEQNNYHLNGENNSIKIACDGLRLICKPNDEYSEEIKDILKQEDFCFPFEYYSIQFSTFSGEGYTGYRRFIHKLFLDHSSMNGDYAAREYIKDVYVKNVTVKQKAKHENEYRKYKSGFVGNVLAEVNQSIEKYNFDVKTDVKSNLINDLSIKENEVSICNMGQGKQCFIKTEFALMNGNSNDIDILLLEEPENHLSHVNMKKLIYRIAEANLKQMFITTHNNMISTRLDLRKIIMLNSSQNTPPKVEYYSR